MAPPPDGTAQINEASGTLKESTAKVGEQHGKVSEALRKLIDTINHTLSTMGRWSWVGGLGGLAAAHVYGEKIREAMQRLKAAVEKVLALVKKILDEAVPVVSLVTRAFDWLDQVQAPVNSMVETAETYTINLNNWSGPVQTAYDKRVPQQSKAIGDLATAAADTAKWLADLAAANASYILSCFKPLFDIGGALGAALVDAATVLGALEAIGKSGELVQIAVSAMYEALDNAVNHVMGVIGKMVDAKATMGELGDSWPQMVTL